MIVALDTMVLIWGLRNTNPEKGTLSVHDVDAARRSKTLLRDLEEKKHSVIIPCVAAAELLCPIDHSDHGKFIVILNQRFFCPPFDLRAASLAAELWRFYHELPTAERVKRSVLKADGQIVATAKVAGPSLFYSHDKKCRNLATRAGMKALDLPTHSEDLFIDAEMRETSQQAPPSLNPRKT